MQYIRRGLNLRPLLTGGGQEGGLRPGTEPTAQAAALAAACAAWQEDYPARIQEVKEYALESLSAVPGLEIISRGDAPHICAVSLPGYPSEMLVRELDVYKRQLQGGRYPPLDTRSPCRPLGGTMAAIPLTHARAGGCPCRSIST